MHAVEHEFVVQVRAGCQPCGSNGTDRLALFHSLPLFHQSFGEMQVFCLNAVGVLDEYVVPVGSGIVGTYDGAITGSVNRGSARCQM